jgi:2-oxoglutarate ferredoxin oxidoreductase subunit beta
MGRDVEIAGFPIRMAEIIAQTPGAAYVVRRSLYGVKEIRQAKKALLTAFKVQLAGLGFSMVELLSTCPINWRMTADEALTWADEHMTAQYPPGDYKVIDAVADLK